MKLNKKILMIDKILSLKLKIVGYIRYSK